MKKMNALLAAISRPTLTKTLALALAVGLSIGNTGLPMAMAQKLDQTTVTVPQSTPVKGQIAISRDVKASTGTEPFTLSVRDLPLPDLLYMLAEAGHFNIILDASVTGTITVDLKNVSVNKALEYIFTISDLNYTKDGNTVIVASNATADEKALAATTLKAIPVQYKDAATIATQLNDTIFKVPRPGGSTKALAASDPDSNSLLVMGTDSDIKLVGDALRELDVPRNRKVYTIRHGDPGRVADILAANFFTPAGSTSNSSGSTSSSSSGGTSSSSSGSTSSSGSGSTSSSGSGGTSSSSSSTSSSTGVNSFTTGGVTFVSEPLSGTLTVMATDEQLALIDSVIDQVDVRRPQAAIEVSLVEIQNADLKTLVPQWSPFRFGKDTLINLNGLDADGNATGINLFGLDRTGLTKYAGGMSFTTLTVSHSHKVTRSKVLANPTIVALDGTSSTIDITDQVPSVSQTTITSNGVTTITNTITTQDAGVTLELTPKIFNDGSVELKLSPKVTQPLSTFRSGAASSVLLAERSVTLDGVRVRDGQTLIIGGLLREHTSLDVDKIPGLGNLPIVKAMFNATSGNNRDRTELVLMVTPHIIKEEAVPYFNNGDGGNAPKGKYNNLNQGGIQPVSLPKFLGSSNTAQIHNALKQADKPEVKMTPATEPEPAVSPRVSPEPAGSVESPQSDRTSGAHEKTSSLLTLPVQKPAAQKAAKSEVFKPAAKTSRDHEVQAKTTAVSAPAVSKTATTPSAKNRIEIAPQPDTALQKSMKPPAADVANAQLRIDLKNTEVIGPSPQQSRTSSTEQSSKRISKATKGMPPSLLLMEDPSPKNQRTLLFSRMPQ